VYIPQSLWAGVRDRMVAMMADIRMGDPRDFRNFMGAVIDERSFTKIGGYLDEARAAGTIVAGGEASKEKGYFVSPTLVKVDDPSHRILCEEIFGPVVAAYVYPDDQYVETMQIVDQTSPYALTGAIFANDRQAIRLAHTHLRNAAGNFYINDKCTGAVVGQQPFGGARGSGTNDKAGSKLNFLRWVSPRSIKETFVPPTSYPYPFMGEE
jgi:1-pyrroline-5-carboxylate dehydrogenase